MKKDRPEIIEAKALMLARLPGRLNYEQVAEQLGWNGRREIRWLVDAGLLTPLVAGTENQSSKFFHVNQIVEKKFDDEWLAMAEREIKRRNRINNGYISIVLLFIWSINWTLADRSPVYSSDFTTPVEYCWRARVEEEEEEHSNPLDEAFRVPVIPCRRFLTAECYLPTSCEPAPRLFPTSA